MPMLTACGDPNLAKTFAQIKAIKVDAAGDSDSQGGKLSAKDVQLAVNTAKDLTVNSGGLFNNKDTVPSDGSTPNSISIAVVDPLKVPPPDDGGALDVGVAGQVAPKMAPEATVQLVAGPTTRFIQVGSFGTTDAARDAWDGLVERYPGVERYHPSFQSVVTASGKAMVRLKVGPVAGEDQARDLCGQLGIHDAWCAKAG